MSNAPIYKFRLTHEAPVQLRVPLAGVGSIVLEPGVTYQTAEYDDIRRISDDPRFEVIVELPVVENAPLAENPVVDAPVESERKPKRGDK